MAEAQFMTPRYNYGEVASTKTSWTTANPGRRFFRCRKYGVSVIVLELCFRVLVVLQL